MHVLVERFDSTFLMFRQLVGIGIANGDPEAPVFVTQWILTGECDVADSDFPLSLYTGKTIL